jgi:hypothetical protein
MTNVTKDASNEKLVDYINNNLSNAQTAYNAAYGSTSTVGTEEGQ